ncbi:MAG: hypothetical protein U1F42_05545 [Candidatus Competibacteraceae bacterium]
MAMLKFLRIDEIEPKFATVEVITGRNEPAGFSVTGSMALTVNWNAWSASRMRSARGTAETRGNTCSILSATPATAPPSAPPGKNGSPPVPLVFYRPAKLVSLAAPSLNQQRSKFSSAYSQDANSRIRASNNG